MQSARKPYQEYLATATRWYLCVVAFFLPFMFGSQIMATESANYPTDFLVWMILLFTPMGPGFLASLLAGIGLLLAIIAHPAQIRVDRSLAWTLLWLLPVAAGIIGISVTTEIDYARNWLLHFIGAASFGLAVWWTSRHDSKMLPAIMSSIAASTLLLCLNGWYQRLGGLEAKLEEMSAQHRAQFGEDLPMQIRQKLLQLRINSFFSDPNIFAAHLLVAIPITVAAVWRWLAKATHNTRLAITSLAAVFMLVAFYWTGSRGATIGACVGLAIAVWTLPWIQGRKWKWLLPIICLLFVAAIIGYAKLNAARGGMATVSVRMNYYHAAWTLFKQQPLTGIGLGEFYPWYMRIRPVDAEISRDPHCFFLSALSQCGIGGGLAVIALMLFPLAFALGKTRFRTSEPTASFDATAVFASAVAAGLGAWCVHSFFQFNELIPATVFLLPLLPIFALDAWRPTPVATAETAPRPMTALQRSGQLLHVVICLLAVICILYSLMKIPCEKRLQFCEEDLMKLQAMRDAVRKKQLQFQDTSAMKRELAAFENDVALKLKQLMMEMGFAPAPCKLACEEYKRRILSAPTPDAVSPEDVDAMQKAAEELVKRVPHRSSAHCQLAWADIAANDWEGAAASLEEARLWFPFDPTHLLLRAVVEARSKTGLQVIEHVQAVVVRGDDGRPLLSVESTDETQRQILTSLVNHLPPLFPDMDFRVNEPSATNN